VLRSTSSVSAEGGASFREHAVNPADYAHTSTGLRTISMIRQGGWDFVVLQDQSGSWFYFKPCTFSGQSDCLDAYVFTPTHICACFNGELAGSQILTTRAHSTLPNREGTITSVTGRHWLL